MTHQIINLITLLILGILYLYTFAMLQNKFFSKLTSPKNQAVLILYIAAIASASINLIHIADISSDALLFFLDQDNYIKGILYSVAFFSGMWLFSLAFFRTSFFIVGLLSPENEMDELIKNNKEIAWIHAIIVITISFVIAPAIVKIASSFIPYPTLPF